MPAANIDRLQEAFFLKRHIVAEDKPLSSMNLSNDIGGSESKGVSSGSPMSLPLITIRA